MTLLLLLCLTSGYANTTIVEAENYSAQSGCSIATNNAGYSGTGFLDYGGNGTYGEWNNISVSSAGTKSFDIYYANGSTANRQCEITVNGSSAGNIAFEPTGGWSTWQKITISIPLNSGDNIIRITANTSNGGPNIDMFEVHDPIVEPTTNMEAEDYTAQSGCSVATNNAGYSGTGFLDYGGNGTYGEWNNISVSSAGTKGFDIYYANGSTANRQCEITVNGSSAGNIAFEPTGDWSTWAKITVSLPFNAGNNTVRITANTSSGGPNIDMLGVQDTSPDTEATIDFENLADGSISTNPYEDPSGINFTGVKNTGALEALVVVNVNGNKAIRNHNYDSKVIVEKNNGTDFDLSSFDYAGDPWGGFIDATITGYNASGGTVTEQISGDGTVFATKTLNWNALTKVEINFGGGTNNAYGLLDNFTVSGATDSPSPENLISNNEFDNGTTGWTASFQGGATGSFDVVSESMSGSNAGKLSITNGGSATWNIEVFSLFNLESSKTYAVTFKAKAASNRSASVIFQKNGDPYTEYWAKNIALTTSTQDFGPFTWTSNIDDPNTRFNFKVGGDAADIWIDAIEVKEVIDTEAPSAPTGLTASNIVKDGFTLSWAASSDNIEVASYEVFAGPTSMGTTSSTYLNVIGLNCNTSYSMTVKAKDASGNESNASSALSVTTLGCDAPDQWPAVGMGLDGLSWWSPYPPFADVVKSMRWLNAGSWDANGYPTSVGPNATYVTGQAGYDNGINWPDGDYVLTWEGSGDVVLTNGATLVSEDLNSNPKRRVYAINTGKHAIMLQINSFPATNIHAYLPGLENHNSMWNPEYLAYLEPFRGSVLRFMDLNGTNHSEQENWSDRTPKNWSTYVNQNSNSVEWSVKGRASYESMIELSNELDCDMWVCIPHMATEDYVTKLANLIKTGKDGAQQVTQPLANKVWIEYSNEVWNWSFRQSTWVDQNTSIPGSNVYQKYANQAVKLFNTFRTAFGDNNRVKRILGTQTGYGDAWVTKQYFSVIDPQTDVDAVGIATYFSHGVEQWMHDNWPVTQQQTLDYLTNQLGSGPFTATEAVGTNERVWKQFDVCAQYGNIPLVAYEGNSHMVASKMIKLSDGTTRYLFDLIPESVAFMHDLERTTAYANLYENWLMRFESTGNGLFKTNMPFVLLAGWSKWGQWGHVEHTNQTVNEAPKYKMLLDHYNLPYPTLSATSRMGSFEMPKDPEDKVVIYPNPSVNGMINVKFDRPTDNHLEITDATGKVYLSKMIKNGSLIINVSSYKKGMYFFKVNGAYKKAMVK